MLQGNGSPAVSVRGQGDAGAQLAAPRCPSTTNDTRDHPQKPGETERGRVCFLAIHLPSCASVVCVPRYQRLRWSHQPQLGRQVYYRDQRFPCSVPKSSPACDELDTPRSPDIPQTLGHRLQRRSTASASAGASPIATGHKYTWDGEPGSARIVADTGVPITGTGASATAKPPYLTALLLLGLWLGRWQD